MLNTMRRYAENMNCHSGFPTFGVIALWVLIIFFSLYKFKTAWHIYETSHKGSTSWDNMQNTWTVNLVFIYFWSYCPLCVNNFRVRTISLKPLDIFSWNFTQMLNTIRRCAEHMNRNSGYTPVIRSMQCNGVYSFLFWLCLSDNNFCVRSITLKPLDIFSWNLTQMLNIVSWYAEPRTVAIVFPTFRVIAFLIIFKIGHFHHTHVSALYLQKKKNEIFSWNFIQM